MIELDPDRKWERARQFGDQLRTIRDRKNMKGNWIAEQIGVRFWTYSRWETGVAVPTFNHVFDLARVLGVAAWELLRGIE